MENEIEVNDIVDKIIENLESSLGKLGQSLKIDKSPKREDVSKVQKDKQPKIKEIPKHEPRVKTPYESVRYPTQVDTITIKDNYDKSDDRQTSYSSNLQILIPKEQIKEKTKKTTIFESIPEITEIRKEKELNLADEEIEQDLSTITADVEYEISFLDIPRAVRLIHLFGPPGTAKTTLALQTAVEISPKKSYYFITSHASSVIKRIKLICDDERWSDHNNFKQSFFPIEISNLDVLGHQLSKIAELNSEDVDLIIIDHLTDYSRGQIHKEENRSQLRELLERLYVLADEKNCKVIIINGYSFKESAPAEDIVESFCDMTLQTSLEDQEVKLFAEGERYDLLLDDSGVKNLHVNVYY